MADNGAIAEMVDQTAQSRFRRDADEAGIASVLTGLIRAGEILPAWWSRQRDIDLFRFLMQSDHMQSAIYRVSTKLTSVTPRVVPRDTNIKSSIALAEDYNAILFENWELGQGWQTGLMKDLEDLFTKDNGFYREITGPGPKDGPIIGLPTGTISLDSLRCTRTNSPEFPVTYQDTDGQRYKFHHTRVMYAAQSPSTKAEMYGVGRCWLTRAINTAQNLVDILLFKQEKMGSRPARQMLIGRGITAEQLFDAILDAEESMDNQGLRRYAKTIAIGSQSVDVGVDRIDLANIPDGFDERTSVELGMFVIALAIGIPPRDLWPATTTGSTKADAETQHVSGSAGYQAILDLFSYLIGGSPAGARQQIRGKFLPPSLKLEFDFVDDEQDARHAQNSAIRATTRERDLNDGVVTVRVAREQAFSAGDLTQSQFEELELGDGRLPDGTSVLNLFLTTDRGMQRLLSISTPNPLDVEANQENTAFILEQIKDALLLANLQAVNATTSRLKQQARQAVRALTELERIYRGDEEEEEGETENADENAVSEQTADDQEEKQLPERDIVNFAPLDAQAANYRKATRLDILDGRRCSTCAFNERDTVCTLFNFNFTRGFVCDRFENRTTSAILRRSQLRV
jgi:hypothetical protein